LLGENREDCLSSSQTVKNANNSNLKRSAEHSADVKDSEHPTWAEELVDKFQVTGLAGSYGH
jgi:hypothetical protein